MGRTKYSYEVQHGWLVVTLGNPGSVQETQLVPWFQGEPWIKQRKKEWNCHADGQALHPWIVSDDGGFGVAGTHFSSLRVHRLPATAGRVVHHLRLSGALVSEVRSNTGQSGVARGTLNQWKTWTRQRVQEAGRRRTGASICPFPLIFLAAFDHPQRERRTSHSRQAGDS